MVRPPVKRLFPGLAVVFALVVGAGLVPACAADKPEPRTVEIIVPAGSRDRMRAG